MAKELNGMHLHIRGGRVLDPRNGIDKTTDLYLADGVVAALGGQGA